MTERGGDRQLKPTASEHRRAARPEERSERGGDRQLKPTASEHRRGRPPTEAEQSSCVWRVARRFLALWERVTTPPPCAEVAPGGCGARKTYACRRRACPDRTPIPDRRVGRAVGVTTP